MSIHVTMTDNNSNKKLTLYPHNHESHFVISQMIGNPPKYEELSNIWIRNTDLRKAIKALEDLS